MGHHIGLRAPISTHYACALAGRICEPIPHDDMAYGVVKSSRMGEYQACMFGTPPWAEGATYLYKPQPGPATAQASAPPPGDGDGGGSQENEGQMVQSR